MACLRLADKTCSRVPVFLVHIAVWSLSKGLTSDSNGTHLSAVQSLKQRLESCWISGLICEYCQANAGLHTCCICPKAADAKRLDSQVHGESHFLTFHIDLLASLHGRHNTQRCMHGGPTTVQHGAGACLLLSQNVETITPQASRCTRSCCLWRVGHLHLALGKTLRQRCHCRQQRAVLDAGATIPQTSAP